MSGVVLASASPRRRELLSNICRDFEVRVSPVDEAAIAARCRSPKSTVLALSLAKASAVPRKEGETVIGADTVVCLGRKILGKPKDEAEAAEMLRALSGRTHKVRTGVTVIKNGKPVCYAVCTRVCFRRLREEEIAAYVSSGEGMDKAGGYGIQGGAGKFLRRLRGDYFNVVGLPLKRLSTLIG